MEKIIEEHSLKKSSFNDGDLYIISGSSKEIPTDVQTSKITGWGQVADKFITSFIF